METEDIFIWPHFCCKYDFSLIGSLFKIVFVGNGNKIDKTAKKIGKRSRPNIRIHIDYMNPS